MGFLFLENQWNSHFLFKFLLMNHFKTKKKQNRWCLSKEYVENRSREEGREIQELASQTSLHRLMIISQSDQAYLLGTETQLYQSIESHLARRIKPCPPNPRG